MSKSTIASIIGLVALLVGGIFHIEITQDLQLQIVELIAGFISTLGIIVGIVQKHKAEKQKDTQ